MATTELVSSQIWELTQGPDAHASAQRALAFIDAQFPTVDDLDALDQASQSAQAKRAELQVKVRMLSRHDIGPLAEQAKQGRRIPAVNRQAACGHDRVHTCTARLGTRALTYTTCSNGRPLQS